VGSATTSRARQIEVFHNPEKYYYYHCQRTWLVQDFLFMSHSVWSLISIFSYSKPSDFTVSVALGSSFCSDKMSQAPEATPFSTCILSLFRLQQDMSGNLNTVLACPQARVYSTLSFACRFEENSFHATSHSASPTE
jgi:hypothetical protein